MSGSVATVFNQQPPERSWPGTGDIIRELQPTEPLYLFCSDTLGARAQQFRDGFPGTVSYAVKANPEARILKTLAASGIHHFDVASLAEIQAVLSHCPAAVLHYNNPVKAAEAISCAYETYGVRSFALDEMSEFEKIHTATHGDTSVVYTVRFKLQHNGAAYDFGSKFGAAPKQATALLKSIAASGARIALTFHPGSQCTDPDMYRRYLKTAAEITQSAGVKPELINVGGGFPEYYQNTEAPQLEAYFTVIEEAARRYFDAPPNLMCEPGRGMVASAVTLLSKVIHVRDCGLSLFVNDGVYGGMLEQSIVDLRVPVLAWRHGAPLSGDSVSYQIFGPTCDPVDKLSRKVKLPEGLSTGDYIEFGLLGAYGSATSTGFNGFESGTYLNIDESSSFT